MPQDPNTVGMLGWQRAIYDALVSGASASVKSATIISAQTAATGADFTAFGAAACTSVAIDNTRASATDIEVRRGASGSTIVVPTGSSRVFFGVTDASDLQIRRVDQSNSQVTVDAEAIDAAASGAATIISATTSATGATYVQLPNAAARMVDIINTALGAVDLEVRRGGSGGTIIVTSGGSRMFVGLTNAAELQVRRRDLANVQITFTGEALA